MSNKNNDNNDEYQQQQEILDGLTRLSKSLAELDDQHSSPELSHFGESPLPPDVLRSYETMEQGASLIHATSTKYTLMGRISIKEQDKIAQDLSKGCQLVATGAIALCLPQANVGTSRSLRKHVKMTARSIVATTSQLIESFVTHVEHGDDAAPRTGAVWEATNVIMQKKLPMGNRNAMRRDLFTWMMECKDTLEEFQQIVDLGPKQQSQESEDDKNDDDEEEDYDDFGMGDDDEQYTSVELPIVEACLGLIKCSRGSINATLKACETAGTAKAYAWISQVHDLARVVGEGITDLGALLYPPDLDFEELQPQLNQQALALEALHNTILDTTATLELPEDIIALTGRLRTTAQTKQTEANQAIIDNNNNNNKES